MNLPFSGSHMTSTGNSVVVTLTSLSCLVTKIYLLKTNQFLKLIQNEPRNSFAAAWFIEKYFFMNSWILASLDFAFDKLLSCFDGVRKYFTAPLWSVSISRIGRFTNADLKKEKKRKKNLNQSWQVYLLLKFQSCLHIVCPLWQGSWCWRCCHPVW